MEKVAIVTLVTNPEWQRLAEVTLPSQRQYAERLHADFLIIDKAIHAHPHYDKWQLYDILGTYDRIIYLDCDMVVRPDCPDLFVCVPPEFVAGENELLSFPGQQQHLERFCRLMGFPPLPCPFYINGGMFMASAQHRQLFRPPERVITDIPWPEQNHLNSRLIGENYKVCFLPQAFNDRHRQGDYLRGSYILHYSVMSNDQRIPIIKRDLAAWDRLFRGKAWSTSTREPVPMPAAPPASAPTEQFRDYVSPGLKSAHAERFFPDMVPGDRWACPWPYLRREIPHTWYEDRRAPTVGFLNRDEAAILHTTALNFRGQAALEIGCWLGWSACNLALAGVRLDVIDPILERREFYASVAGSLAAAGVLNNVNLVPGYSPQKVHELASLRQGKWSLFFIDGNHEAPGPLQDTIACEGYAGENAMMLFHDLSSPDVAQGLDYLKDHGWQTLVYQTMQIMGVAWRGNVQPLRHIPDPQVNWPVVPHLHRHQICA